MRWAITQRLAQTVFVSDLGVVEVRLGATALPRGLRRKVLALLCFLSSRPGMAATRDEALDALWPDLSPDVGGELTPSSRCTTSGESLSPTSEEGMSAGYIQVDGEVVSLHHDARGHCESRVLAAPRDRRDRRRRGGRSSDLLGLYRGQICTRLRLRGLVCPLPREPPCRSAGGGGGRSGEGQDDRRPR